MDLSSHRKRPPALAGSWYPADPIELRRQIEDLFDQARQEGAEIGEHIRALIVPHAGLAYSGPTAAHAFGSVKKRPSRIILLGPTHRMRFEGVSAGSFSHYSCPLGDFPVDRLAVEGLVERGLVQARLEAHLEEHCLEMMLPFIGARWGETLIVPLLVGQASPEEVRRILEALFKPGDLVCVSSDLSHFLTYDQAYERDLRTLESIHAGRWSDLGPRDACGCIAVAGLIQFSAERHLSCSILDYRNSGDTGGGRQRVVGYGALAYQTSDSQ